MNPDVHNAVETALLQNFDKPNSLFIFPTDIALSRWADHLLRLKSGSVAMNKFIAWDKFKENLIKSKILGRKSIPPALRKIFVNMLINENANNCMTGKPPVFNSLIQEKWAEQASQFVSWITGILPQLGIWYKKTTGLSIAGILDNEETASSFFRENDSNSEKDFFILALRYAHFLSKLELFEPAWETPPFNDDGIEYFIFFSDSLSDYSEYKQLLETSDHVKVINARDPQTPCDSFFYSNSRREITEASLYILALHDNSDIDWDSIAVCIPDSQDYEYYLIREFKNRNIPFVKRVSKRLSDYPAGKFFRSALDCISQNFSFPSVVSLLMNRNLPWNDTLRIDKLIKFGIENNCLYSWTEITNGKKQYVNVWEEAFKKPVNGIESDTRKYFEKLKHCLYAMRSSASFSDLLRQYFSFSSQFFDLEKCTEETSLVLSRCITELVNLAEIEKNFLKDEITIDPFTFFTDYIGEIFYLQRPKLSGVAILPYRTAAAAPFDCHIVLGAGQESLSVVYSRLDFLPKKKRKELDIQDEDVSADFINMHKNNSNKISAFFCSEQTFSGFAIPHSKIDFHLMSENKNTENPETNNKFFIDWYNTEILFSSVLGSKSVIPIKLHENQINGFMNWADRRIINESINKNRKDKKIIKDYILSRFGKDGKYSVSATSLQSYFQCSIKWLFERVFSPENVQTETSLMQENISGLIYHSVLDKFFTKLKNKNETLSEPVYSDFGLSLPSNYDKLLEQSVDTVFDEFPVIKSERDSRMSFITGRLMNAVKKDFKYNLENCLSHFFSFFAGCRVAASEKSYVIEKETFMLRGTVDCLLEDISDTSESRYIIVDFKLKNLPRRADCTGEDENSISNFQLPMYITLAEESEKIKVDTALFFSILEPRSEVIFGSIEDKNTGMVFPKKDDEIIIFGNELYNKIMNEFNEKTEQFSREISTYDFSVFPSKNSDCLKCAHQRICRTVYIVNRENIKTFGAAYGKNA